MASLNNEGPIKFSISGDSNNYLDLSSSYLLLKVKITKADSTDLDAQGDAAPINLLGHTLFQQVEIMLNDVVISNTSNLYHYRALIETLLSYSDEAKKLQLSMSLYSKDTPGKMDHIGGENESLEARRRITGQSKTAQLIVRPHADIFFQRRFILNGVDMKLKFVRNHNSLVLMAGENATCKQKILNTSFFLRKVKINSGIPLKHIENLEKKTFARRLSYQKC